MTEGYKYDFFISYADDGQGWVNGELLPKLHRAAKKCLREEDFENGKSWLESMQEAVMESYKVLLVLTPQYLASREKEFIKVMGFTKGVEQRGWPVIPILIKPVDRELLLRSIGVVDLTSTDQEEALSRLLQHEGIEDTGQEKKIITPPYPGMVPFKEEDERIFFGREDEIVRYVDYLHENRLLVLVGASGCGKSSLAAAGVIPKLRRSQHLFGNVKWLVKRFRPSEQPFAALAQQYGDTAFTEPEKLVETLLHERSNADCLLLFIDQFEEVFALDQQGVDEPKQEGLGEQAQAFLQTLASLAKQKNVFVIITVRDEFYHQLAWCQEWFDLDKHLRRVGFLGRKGLVDAIRKPAEKEGVWLDDVLVERLVNDAGDDPGILPFVQETMRKLWGMMDERYLRVEDYEKLGAEGGISGLKYAIAVKADSAFKSLPSEAHRNIARRIFIRLVQFGEGKPDTRRQQPLAALCTEQDPPGVFDETLMHLSSEQYRLLILSGEKGDKPTVDIVHESLIKAWPLLVDWIKEYKKIEEKWRIFETKFNEWRRLGMGEAGLLDKEELKEVDDLIKGNEKAWLFSLNKEEYCFVEKSRAEINPGWSRKGGAFIVLVLLSLFEIIYTFFDRVVSFGSLGVLFVFLLFLLFSVAFLLNMRGRYYRLQKLSRTISINKKLQRYMLIFFLFSSALFVYAAGRNVWIEVSCQYKGINTSPVKLAGEKIFLLGNDEVSPERLSMIGSVFDSAKNKMNFFIDGEIGYCEKFFSQKVFLKKNGKHYSAVIKPISRDSGKVFGDGDAIYEDNKLEECSSIVDVGYKILEYLGYNYPQKIYSGSCQAVSLYFKCQNDMEKKYILAIDECEESIKDSPEFLNAYVLLSTLYLKNKDTIDKAVNIMEEAYNRSGYDDHVMLAERGRAYLHQGKYENAEKFYKMALSKYDFSFYYIQLSAIYRERGCKDCLNIALDYIARAEKKGHTEKILTRETRNLIIKNRAIVYYLMDEYADSNNLFEELDKDFIERNRKEILFYKALNYIGMDNRHEGCRLSREQQGLSSWGVFLGDAINRKGENILKEKCK